MKRVALMKKLSKVGCIFEEGGKHTKIYQGNEYITALPRHTEIKDTLAKIILRQAGLGEEKE